MVRNIQEIKNPGPSNHFQQLVAKCDTLPPNNIENLGSVISIAPFPKNHDGDDDDDDDGDDDKQNVKVVELRQHLDSDMSDKVSQL